MKLSEVAKFYNLPDDVYVSLQTKREKEEFFRKHHPNASFYQELEMDSKYVDAHQDVSFFKEEVNLHSHEFFELLYVRTGNIEYYLGTNRFKVTSGDAIIIPPGVSHRPILPDVFEEPYRRYVMWISKETKSFIEENLLLETSYLNKPMLLHLNDQSYIDIKELFSSACYENIERKVGWQSSIFGKAMELAPLLTRAKNDIDNSVTPEKPQMIDEIVSYIEEHMLDKLTLENVAKQFYVSESTISQLFKKKLDVSFYHYVTQRRLICSKNYILKGEPLDNIYQLVGFNDYSTFFKAFKKEYGISPSAFKNIYAKQ